MKSLVTLTRNGKHWRACWRDSTGQRCSRGLGAMDDLSRTDALLECQRIAGEEFTPAGTAPTLKDWGETYLEQRENDLSDGSLRLHRCTLAYLREHLGDGAKIDQITRAHAAGWRAWLSSKVGLQTVASHVRIAKVVFKFAADQDLIKANPFDRLSGAAPEVDRNWTHVSTDDLVRILDACPDSHWRSLFALCRLAGLRRGEALRLAWSDFDWVGATLSVSHVGRRTTKRKPRIVPMVPVLAALMAEYHQTAGEGSVGPCDGLDDDRVGRGVGPILARAGFGACRKPLHDLRKCCITEWMARYPVLSVAEWAGHSPAVAAKHYTRTAPETMERVTGVTTRCGIEAEARARP